MTCDSCSGTGWDDGADEVCFFCGGSGWVDTDDDDEGDHS